MAKKLSETKVLYIKKQAHYDIPSLVDLWSDLWRIKQKLENMNFSDSAHMTDIAMMTLISDAESQRLKKSKHISCQYIKSAKTEKSASNC